MELRQIRYFLAVAEELHFTRAAELRNGTLKKGGKGSVALAFLELDRWEQLVLKKHEFGGLHEVVVSAWHKAGFMPQKIQATRLLQTALCLVGGGLGVALVPESFREKVQVTGVVYRPLASTLVVDLVAFWLNGNQSSLLEKLRAFFPDALAADGRVY